MVFIEIHYRYSIITVPCKGRIAKQCLTYLLSIKWLCFYGGVSIGLTRYLPTNIHALRLLLYIYELSYGAVRCLIWLDSKWIDSVQYLMVFVVAQLVPHQMCLSLDTLFILIQIIIDNSFGFLVFGKFKQSSVCFINQWRMQSKCKTIKLWLDKVYWRFLIIQKNQH